MFTTTPFLPIDHVILDANGVAMRTMMVTTFLQANDSLTLHIPYVYSSLTFKKLIFWTVTLQSMSIAGST